MRRFAELYAELDAVTGTGAKVEALVAYFRCADPADAAWALQVLLGKQRRRLITGLRLRRICLEGTALPAWLFEECYAQVGDSAETVALLWEQVRPDGPQAGGAGSTPKTAPGQPLHHWMEVLLPALAALEGEAQARAVRELWSALQPGELLVANKLLSGGLRVGVARGLVIRALARLSGLEEPLLAHRLMGAFTPSARAYSQLIAPAASQEAATSRPYPFFLASALPPAPQGEPPLPGPLSAWLCEWKWDGIRGQLIRRRGSSFLWSRGEELINEAFPELIEAAAGLADGTVLDGELIVWPQDADRPAAFAELQRRLGRRTQSRRLLETCPVVFLAYDLLEEGGEDRRPWPLSRRRAALEALVQHWQRAADSHGAGRLRLSPLLPLASWEQLESRRQQARDAGAEGLMLKAAASPYLAGRRRGHWWKHKLDPHRLDAVLLYAQAGSGRRANLFTDYTFGLWDGDGRLVSFAKAYSGLDDGEIAELDRWIRGHTSERFGPVRAVQPLQVFELAFEGLQRSRRHRSGIAVRFPRIARWRRDKPAAAADSLATALALLPGDLGHVGAQGG